MTEDRERPIIEARTIEALLQYPALAGEWDLLPEHFRSDERLRSIARALAETEFFAEDGSAPLVDVLSRSGVDLAWARGLFVSHFPSAECARHWPRQLADRERREQLRAAVQKCFRETATTADLVGSLAAVIHDHEQRERAVGVETMRAVALRFANDRLRDLSAGKMRTGIPTGFATLDRAIKGWRPGELTVLVAGPGVGKSTLAEHWRRHLARRGLVTLLFSGEMTAEQLGERYVHAETLTPLSEDLTDVQRLSEAAFRIETSDPAARMLLDTRPGMTPARVLGVARAEIAKRGSLALLLIDHLRHLEASPSPREYEQVSASVAAAKKVAKDAPAPVLLLTHLSRERKEMRGPDAEPTLEMIRGSGRIEDDADNVVTIWRPEGRPAYLRVLKSRQGGLRSKIELDYDRFSQSYGEVREV